VTKVGEERGKALDSLVDRPSRHRGIAYLHKDFPRQNRSKNGFLTLPISGAI
jgi:hypothetical protein